MRMAAKIDLDKWNKLVETENFVKFRAKRKWLMFSVTDEYDVLELCEIFKMKGYRPHLNEYSWDGSILFEKIGGMPDSIKK